MNILEEIIAFKKEEVARRKRLVTSVMLQRHPLFERPVISLARSLADNSGTGIIAEFKRRSPSKGTINADADVVEVTRAYAISGASALSVLTDHQFFGGSAGDLMQARINELPILRKDFTIDEYQILEAKAMGADAILLIAACLTPQRVRELATLAGSIGLEVLLELHDERELEHVYDNIRIVGINNRSLETFEVDLEHSLRLAEKLPRHLIRVAESGIDTAETIVTFRNHGYCGFLIGEAFMRSPDPSLAFARFVESLKTISV